jgi:hypothetical protein
LVVVPGKVLMKDVVEAGVQHNVFELRGHEKIYFVRHKVEDFGDEGKGAEEGSTRPEFLKNARGAEFYRG